MLSGSKIFSRRSLLAGGAALLGTGYEVWRRSSQSSQPSERKFAGIVPFAGEGHVRMDTAFGEELDGRLFTDLSQLRPQDAITSVDRFYIRTRASKELPTASAWCVRVGGPKNIVSVPVQKLISQSEPQGIQLMECSGNPRGAHFGMIGVANWAGVSVGGLLRNAGLGGSGRVLISGFDEYSTQPKTSVPGASWVFSVEDLHKSRAFLASSMNGRALTADHGAPVRLVVPNWYGCCCIKWVNEIRVVPEDAVATSQMREYASRTHQQGIPELAREYEPAAIDTAAMPVRVEKWVVAGRSQYVVDGIVWGGTERIRALDIRFNPDEDYVPIDFVDPLSRGPLTFWQHVWQPAKTGLHRIRLRVADPKVRSRRLDKGYYVRSVNIEKL